MVPLKSGDPAQKFPIPAETSRLTLRRIRPEDKTDLLDLADADVDADIIQSWLSPELNTSFIYAGESLPLAIEIRAQRLIIGTAWINYLMYASEDERTIRRRAGFGISIDPRYQKQGFGTEIAQAMIELGFNGIHLHRLTAGCPATNISCRKMLEKAGMRLEGLAYQNHFRDGEWSDTAYYAMLASEFADRPPS